MPTDYAPRSKPMHTREVRYERNDRFLGKRDWQRVAVFERSPALSSSNGGSYDPPSKRRPSGRHGFSGENGRFREHSSRVSESQPMFTSAPGGYGHKPERYVLPGGGMTHCPGSSSSGRNGLRDGGGGEDDFFRERDCERLVSSSPSPAQPLHPYNSVVYDAHPSDGHRGSRYGWDVHSRGEREHHTVRERLSSSPDVLDRRNGGGGGFSRFGWSAAPERELEGRLDRYGATRDPDARIRELPAEELLDPFVSPRFQQSQHQRGGFSLLQEERLPLPPSPPPKKTRLKWGEGLARYEQKNTSRARSHDEEPAPATSNGCVEQEQARGFECKGDADGSLPSSDKEFTPSREHTPTSAPSCVSDKVCGTDHPPLLTCETMATAAPRSPSIPLTTPRSPSIPLASGNEECALSPQPREAEETLDPPAQSLHQQEEEPVLSKETVLLQVEQVELEIELIEKELRALAVQTDAQQAVQADLDKQGCSTEATEAAEELPEDGNCDTDVVMVDATPCQQLEDQPEDQTGNLPGEVPCAITDSCLEDFAHILPQGFVCGRKVYSSPQEAEVWIRNEELHRLNKDRILERMLNKKNILKFKEQSLVLKYRLLKDRYPTKGARKGDAATDGRNGFSQRLPQKLRLSDDQQWLRVVSEPVRQYRETERMPSMILSQGERSAQCIIQSNRLVEDPTEFERERKSINPWTPEEKKLFLEKFAAFYKNFAKIASFLQHKTTGDCVEFYYRNQKTEEFQKLRKKQQLKKRHSRASYLATTTPAASGRLRDYNAASAVAKVTAGKETSSGNVSSIVTGVCSLSSDAPLTPLRGPCERAMLREDHSIKQKGVRSSRNRREQVEEAESEWTDTERELFLDAVLLFGKDFKSIAVHVRSKNEGQCKTFYSKARKRLKLDRIVEQHQLAQEMSATTTLQQASVASPDGGSFPSNATVQARSSAAATTITTTTAASASINSEITTEPSATTATPGVQAGETMSKTPLSRSSDVKLFGQSLLSHPPTMSLTATMAAKAEPCDSTSRGVPFLLGESWCSGSAEAQDREFAARCRSLAAVSSGGGIYRLDQNGGFSGILPEASKLPDGVVDWQQLAATRGPLDLWKGEVMKPCFVGGFCQSSQQQQSHQNQQQQQQHQPGQHQEQQQQQQLFPANWSNGSGSDPLHARILAQFSDQQQLHQQLHQHQRQCLCNRCHCCYCCC